MVNGGLGCPNSLRHSREGGNPRHFDVKWNVGINSQPHLPRHSAQYEHWLQRGSARLPRRGIGALRGFPPLPALEESGAGMTLRVGWSSGFPPQLAHGKSGVGMTLNLWSPYRRSRCEPLSPAPRHLNPRRRSDDTRNSDRGVSSRRRRQRLARKSPLPVPCPHGERVRVRGGHGWSGHSERCPQCLPHRASRERIGDETAAGQ